MRALFLKTLLVILVSAGSVSAKPILTYNFTGSIESYVVPTTGTYNITAFGAQGGSPLSSTGIGGLGAHISGDFVLTQGDVLTIAVGGVGETSGNTTGGGGGSFVVGPGGQPLVIAGGGGGARGPGNGGAGLSGPDGGSASGAGGTAGNGGQGGGSFGAGGGGGFFTDGSNGADGAGGRSFLNGLAGGTGVSLFGDSIDGGFGGGGGAGGNGGGGGGGYSGGGGGTPFGGGGGGSFNGSTIFNSNFVNLPGINSGNGSVLIQELGSELVPEPSSFLMFGAAILCSLILFRLRRSFGTAKG